MYQCSSCGSIDPDHKCPNVEVKSDVEEKADTEQKPDQRANHLRRHDETEAQWRLRRIQEMMEEGLDSRDIAASLNINQESVRGILRKQRLLALEEPLVSSLAMSLTNHTPSDADLDRIKEIRHKADELCWLIDRATRDCPEVDRAKIHLQETVMWAVKALVLPRRMGEGGKTFTRDQRIKAGCRGDEH